MIKPEEITIFLVECKNNNWDLDSDDIEHVLKGDFEYVRKINTIEKTYDNADEAVKELNKIILAKN